MWLVGPGEQVALVREPMNKYDRYVGYVCCVATPHNLFIVIQERDSSHEYQFEASWTYSQTRYASRVLSET